jgi:hypothetical protein
MTNARPVTSLVIGAWSLVVSLVLLSPAGLKAAEQELRVLNDRAGFPRQFEVDLTRQQAAALAKLAADHPAWPRVFAVYVAGESPRGDVPPILGSYALEGQLLRFAPKYDLKPGLRYRVVFRPAEAANPQAEGAAAASGAVTIYLTVPERKRGEPTKVTGVFPSAATLPENQLRFYLHFSAPMSRGEVYSRVRLVREGGQPVSHPFLEIGEELWDASGTRLTLLIHPGRIKRGLRPRQEEGPVLQEGRKYTLVIDKAWRDASGRPLAATFEKKFSVGPPVESPLDPAQWKIVPPAAGSQDVLVVKFPAPLDHALLQRTIAVADASGNSLDGEVTIADEEKTWKFAPAEAWKGGAYELVVDKVLEDLAGNRIGVPFEVDETKPIEKRIAVEEHKIPFVIRAR